MYCCSRRWACSHQRALSRGRSPGRPDGLVEPDELLHRLGALGDETLSREDFERLVAMKTPLLKIRGKWVELDPDQIETAIRFFETLERTITALTGVIPREDDLGKDVALEVAVESEIESEASLRD